MYASNFNLSDYFRRIGFAGDSNKVTLSSLSDIMQCQLQSIPFENLDVCNGQVISLEPEAIVDKLVFRQRGGYCYEVNGLFALALTALGVDWRFVGCRPMTYPSRRPRTHMAILVGLDGSEWLCDVGFGNYGIRQPLCLNHAEPVIQASDQFQLIATDDGEYVLRAWVEGEWVNQYGFDLSSHEWIDFQTANWFNSTHPETLFTQHRVVMRHTPQGRIILFDNTLKTVDGGSVHVEQLDENNVPRILKETFGLSPA